jgi:hypothetical protein
VFSSLTTLLLSSFHIFVPRGKLALVVFRYVSSFGLAVMWKLATELSTIRIHGAFKLGREEAGEGEREYLQTRGWNNEWGDVGRVGLWDQLQ